MPRFRTLVALAALGFVLPGCNALGLTGEDDNEVRVTIEAPTTSMRTTGTATWSMPAPSTRERG
jgi:hypothetical protein